MIKGLIFDFGGVVVSNWNAHGEFYNHLARALHINPGAAAAVIKAHEAEMVALEKGALELNDFFTKLWPEFKTKVSLNETLARELMVGPIQESVSLDQNMLALIGGLRRSGFKTGLLSNTIPEHIDYYLHYWPSIFEVFDAVMLSYDMGEVKPADVVYEKTLVHLGVAASEAVMIDNNPQFVAAAVEYGLKGILFQGYDNLRASLNDLGVEVP